MSHCYSILKTHLPFNQFHFKTTCLLLQCQFIYFCVLLSGTHNEVSIVLRLLICICVGCYTLGTHRMYALSRMHCDIIYLHTLFFSSRDDVLVQLEASLRAFLLKIAVCDAMLAPTPAGTRWPFVPVALIPPPKCTPAHTLTWTHMHSRWMHLLCSCICQAFCCSRLGAR